MFKNLSRSLKALIILILVILVASLGASLVQNSLWGVQVSTVSFETDNGVLAGYLYVPRGVDADNPAPAIVTTHGYLNNAEMQEITAIEMSRRGYVVLAFSMYDHGDSYWNEEQAGAFGFYIYSVYDAVSWMYEQDFVLKDADGNGMIAASGHSMGGYSTECAMAFDEMYFPALGYRKIAVGLPVGSDYRYTPFRPDDTDPESMPYDFYQTRSVGHIAAHYDQFFFDTTGTAQGSVVYKDYTADAEGLDFLGRSAEGTAEAGTYYTVDGGQRVIFTPDETHPQNTWSLETGENTITFYEEAFTYQLDLAGLDSLEDYGITTGTTGQIWWLKEAFTFIALVALFAMLFPLFNVLTGLPLLDKALIKKAEDANEPVEEKKEGNVTKVLVKNYVILLAIFLNFFLLTRWMDRSASLDNLVTALIVLMIVIAVGILAIWILFLVKKDENIKKQALRITLIGAVTVIVCLAYRYILVNRAEIIMTDHYWSAPSVNTIVFWAMCSGMLTIIISLLASIYFNWDREDKNPFGVKASWAQIGTGILNGLVLVVITLLVVALVGWIFKTDFRIYTYAIQIFNSNQFIAALRYMPLFLIYYLGASISVYMNAKNVKGWKGDLLAATLLAGPIVIFLIYQYSVLYSTGIAAFPTFSLSAILTVGLIPTLAVAGIIMRRFSLKTGNIYTGVVFTTVFFTLITLANTTVYLLQAA